MVSIRGMINRRRRPVRLAALLLAALAGGCTLLPMPAPQHDEQAVGAPLPYELPPAGIARWLQSSSDSTPLWLICSDAWQVAGPCAVLSVTVTEAPSPSSVVDTLSA